jgi:hypothetical protein
MAREAAGQARSSIYVIAGDAGDLYDISKYSRKGVKLRILIGIGTAKNSTQLKSLLARGAVIWVDTRAGVNRTMMVVDEAYVWDARDIALNEGPKVSGHDPSLAEDYIRQWHNAVAPRAVIPCYSPSLERERAEAAAKKAQPKKPTRPWPPGAPERPT